MRTLIQTISTTLVLVSFIFADQNAVDTKKVNENFVRGLTHENQGVVESTINIVILMKIKYPDADYDEIIEKLEILILEGATQNIRLKALIASDYLNNFEQYGWLKDGNYEVGEQVFDAYLKTIDLNRMAKTN